MFSDELKLKNYNIIFINENDYEKIKKLIINNIISLCWGKENNDIYSIKEVIAEFMDRLATKRKNQKYGFIGEFIYYLYLINNEKILKPVSLFFNQEEKSFKKGFDLIGFDGTDIWYSEVKSGSAFKKDIDVFNLERLSTAYYDIKNKLNFDDRNTNYWSTAKSNILKVISKEDNMRENVINILQRDISQKTIKSIIIVSVIFDNSDRILDKKRIEKKIRKLQKRNKLVTIVCIRKKTIEKVLSILTEVANEYS